MTKNLRSLGRSLRNWLDNPGACLGSLQSTPLTVVKMILTITILVMKMMTVKILIGQKCKGGHSLVTLHNLHSPIARTYR